MYESLMRNGVRFRGSDADVQWEALVRWLLTPGQGITPNDTEIFLQRVEDYIAGKPETQGLQSREVKEQIKQECRERLERQLARF